MKKLLEVSSVLAIVVGVIMFLGGIWGTTFIYKNVVQENITTPEDATIPNVLVRGPWTLKSQADIIREHTLKITNGKTYSEMPRQIQKVDQNTKPVFDEEGKAVMVSNTNRDIWITATSLTTALNLGIIAYAFSGLILLLGFIFVWIGIMLLLLSRKATIVNL